LDRALQGARAELRIVALRREDVLGGLRDLEAEIAALEALPQARQLHVDDGAQLLATEATVHDDLVEAVEELRTELLPEGRHGHLVQLLVHLPGAEVAPLLDEGQLRGADVAR